MSACAQAYPRSVFFEVETTDGLPEYDEAIVQKEKILKEATDMVTLIWNGEDRRILVQMVFCFHVLYQ